MTVLLALAARLLGNRYVLLAVILAGAAGGIYLKARMDAASAAREAALKAQIASMQRDQFVAAQAAAAAAAAAAAWAKERSRLETEITDYEIEIAARGPGDSCRLLPADIDRLRRIAP